MMQDDQPIHYMQYLELIKRMTSIAGRLNEIESIIGGTKRKWRDEVDLRLTKLEAPNVEQSGYSTENPKFSSNAEKRRYEMQKNPKFTGNPGKNEACEHVWIMQLPKNEYGICKYCDERKYFQPSEKKESEEEQILINVMAMSILASQPKTEEDAIRNAGFLMSIIKKAGWKKEGK